MKFNLMSTRVAVLGMVLMMVNAGSALAASVTLSGVTGSSCSPFTSINADNNGNLIVVCAANVTPSVEPVCNTPTASVNPVVAGGATTLSVNCSGSPTGYAWSTNPTSSFTSSGSTVAVNPSVPTTYSVIATNAIGPSAAKEVLVTITTSPPPPPPGTASCTVVPITWTAGLDLRQGLASSTPLQHLPAGKTYAFSMVVPAGINSSSARTSYTVGVNKDMALSTTACSFTGGLSNAYCKSLGAPDAVVRYSPTSKFLYCTLPPAGTTVYFNVRNGLESTGADTCKRGGAGCEFDFSW